GHPALPTVCCGSRRTPMMFPRHFGAARKDCRLVGAASRLSGMSSTRRGLGRARRRTLLAVLTAAGLVALGAVTAAAPASAGPGVRPLTGTGGFNGPVVTHP